MSRRVVACSVWALTTAVATMVVWAGVSVVTPAITTPHGPVIPQRVVDALAAPVHAAGPSMTPAPSLPLQASAPLPASHAPSAQAGSGTVAPSGPAVPAAAPPSRAVRLGPLALLPSAAAHPAAPTIRSHGTSAPPPTGGTSSQVPSSAGHVPVADGATLATFVARAGAVTVSCQGPTITLVSAIPTNGFSVSVRSAGPGYVVVSFSTARRDVSVHALCKTSQPIGFIDE